MQLLKCTFFLLVSSGFLQALHHPDDILRPDYDIGLTEASPDSDMKLFLIRRALRNVAKPKEKLPQILFDLKDNCNEWHPEREAYLNIFDGVLRHHKNYINVKKDWFQELLNDLIYLENLEAIKIVLNLFNNLEFLHQCRDMNQNINGNPMINNLLDEMIAKGSESLARLAATSVYPVDENGVCKLSDTDYNVLEFILDNEENPEEIIVGLLGECRLEVTDRAGEFMHILLRYQKYGLFGSIVERTNMKYKHKAPLLLMCSIFERDPAKFKTIMKERNLSPEKRDEELTEYLLHIIEQENFEAREFLLAQNFKISESLIKQMSARGENLEKIKDLVSRHPERIAEICPTGEEFRELQTADQGLFMVDLALHCAEVSLKTARLISFDYLEALREVELNEIISVDDKAKVVSQLQEFEEEVTEMITSFTQEQSSSISAAEEGVGEQIVILDAKAPQQENDAEGFVEEIVVVDASQEGVQQNTEVSKAFDQQTSDFSTSDSETEDGSYFSSSEDEKSSSVTSSSQTQSSEAGTVSL